MSRIGRKPVALPSGVTVGLHGATLCVKGPKGELQWTHGSRVEVRQDGETILVVRRGEGDQAKAEHGLTRALIANMVHGVSTGYEKQLEIIGVGYKAQIKGQHVTLSVGYSHTVEYNVPPTVQVTQDEKNKNILTIRGIDKQLVGLVAAQIRAFRPPEPYKGKGIRYTGENVRRKVGKAVIAKTA